MAEDALLASVTQTGIVAFDLPSGVGRVLTDRPDHLDAVSADGRFGFGSQADSYEAPGPRRLVRFDVGSGDTLDKTGRFSGWTELPEW